MPESPDVTALKDIFQLKLLNWVPIPNLPPLQEWVAQNPYPNPRTYGATVYANLDVPFPHAVLAYNERNRYYNVVIYRTRTDFFEVGIRDGTIIVATTKLSADAAYAGMLELGQLELPEYLKSVLDKTWSRISRLSVSEREKIRSLDRALVGTRLLFLAAPEDQQARVLVSLSDNTITWRQADIAVGAPDYGAEVSISWNVCHEGIEYSLAAICVKQGSQFFTTLQVVRDHLPMICV